MCLYMVTPNTEVPATTVAVLHTDASTALWSARIKNRRFLRNSAPGQGRRCDLGRPEGRGSIRVKYGYRMRCRRHRHYRKYSPLSLTGFGSLHVDAQYVGVCATAANTSKGLTCTVLSGSTCRTPGADKGTIRLNRPQ